MDNYTVNKSKIDYFIFNFIWQQQINNKKRLISTLVT